MLARLVLAFGLCLGLFAPADARDNRSNDWPGIEVSALPAEARTTLKLIRAGGPFPYRRDGIEFQNRERRLPSQARGYYREYTVPTPGARDRGARRIIAGEPDEYYYTADHYRSFAKVTP
ncbi:ribonuclease domain-containing protein [Uliginosibacterium sp. H3]|uniref:Ribonuclease domain-containing protein n=1 Tax=Uliginosibacterium silvisoli TaxID=3114758 RepID=A0ABU6K641_9RHOO|nr:ribonuclease domain-containing protein [Uliginosibacterium sp. H3]